MLASVPGSVPTREWKGGRDCLGEEALGKALPEDTFGEVVWEQQVAGLMGLDGLKSASCVTRGWAGEVAVGTDRTRMQRDTGEESVHNVSFD